ncbi:amino acid ABC transporter permease [Salinisphaera sp. RV14]|uniref:amino acid ABC transporter permease n=1 Tax=unclassified Salinisphaera TaxID=2649847 RepID=UPI003F876FD5
MIFGLSFTWLENPLYQQWLLQGLENTLLLSVSCIVASMIIGVVGAWLQGSRFGLVRQAVAVYVQIFRNTPPLVQLFFFFFVLAGLQPHVFDPATGGMRPLLGPFGTSVFALSLFAGAFNVEIFRSGIEAVPDTLDEAAESLGYSRRKRYLAITLPLAFRIAMPALNNNLINLIKTTAEASAIATPELLYYAGQIYSDNFRTLEVMMFIWAVYIVIIAIFLGGMRLLERRLRIPGYGDAS